MKPGRQGGSATSRSMVEKPAEQGVEGDLPLHPGQRGTDAVVDAPAETEGCVVGAPEIEPVRVLETVRIAVGRTLEHHDAVTAGERLAHQLGGLEGGAQIELDRTVESQQLLDGHGGDAGVGPPRGQLVG